MPETRDTPACDAREIIARAIHSVHLSDEEFNESTDDEEDACFELADAVLAALTAAGICLARVDS